MDCKTCFGRNGPLFRPGTADVPTLHIPAHVCGCYALRAGTSLSPPVALHTPLPLPARHAHCRPHVHLRSPGMSLIAMRGLEKACEAPAGKTFVLRHITFDVKPWEVISVMGPSGRHAGSVWDRGQERSRSAAALGRVAVARRAGARGDRQSVAHPGGRTHGESPLRFRGARSWSSSRSSTARDDHHPGDAFRDERGVREPDHPAAGWVDRGGMRRGAPQ